MTGSNGNANGNGKRPTPRRLTPKKPSTHSDDPNRQAPHSKLTAEVSAQIVDAVRAGNYLDTAAAYVGVRKETLLLWMRKGRLATRGPYKQFVEAVEQALAQAEVRDLALIGAAATEEWQAAAWRLERKFPAKYGRRTRVDGNVTVTATPVLDYSKLDAHDIAELRRILTKGEPDPDTLERGTRPALELLPGGDVIDGTAEEIS